MPSSNSSSNVNVPLPLKVKQRMKAATRGISAISSCAQQLPTGRNDDINQHVHDRQHTSTSATVDRGISTSSLMHEPLHEYMTPADATEDGVIPIQIQILCR